MTKSMVTCLLCGLIAAATNGLAAAASPSGGLAILEELEQTSQVPLVINEVMAANSTFVKDLHGDFDDWIEIYNAGRPAIDLAGMYLTDDPTEPTKWRFPLNDPTLTTIAPRGHLIVWADEDDTGVWLHADFRLNADGDGVYLFDTDGVTCIDSLVFGEQTPDVSYGRYPDAGDTLRFFGVPTPGQPNNEGYLGEVATVEISHRRGFYDASFDLTMACSTEDAEILYTLNGKVPNDEGGRFLAGRPYTRPVRVSSTTVVRAMAVKPGWKPSRISTYTYIFNAAESIRSLPVVSLVGDAGKTFYEPDGVMAIVGGTYSNGVWTSTGAGSYNNPLDRGLERPVSCEWIEPEDNSGFQIDCGLRVHGSNYMRPRYTRQSGYWTGSGKFSFRLYFRNRYGPGPLEYPLFAESEVDLFHSIVLRGGHNDRTNPFIKDELLRRLHKDMGQRACMGNFVNVFINGEHKGYFNPTEHIKDDSCQQWFDSDQPWDVMTMNGIRDGNQQSWSDMLDLARSNNLAIDAHYQALLAKLDVVSFIDYLIIRLWPNDWDWPQNNWAAAAERSSAGRWKFFVWDAEGTFRTSELYADRFAELNSQNNPNAQLYRALKASPHFRQLFADRVFKHFHNGGAMSAANINAHFSELRDHLRGIIPNMDTYIISGWTPTRHDVFLDACVREGMYTFDGPVFAVNDSYQQGGYAAEGDLLQIVPALAGTDVYYTLDGTDPAGSTLPVNTPLATLVGRDAPKRVLVPTGPDVGDWTSTRGFDDSDWLAADGFPGGVGYEHSTGYEDHLSIDLQRPMYGINSSCYIRIAFSFSGDRDALELMTLNMQYDDGFVAYLNGTEVARRNFVGEPTWNATAATSNNDFDAVVFEPIDISEHLVKLREGTNMLAIQGLNTSPTSSDLLITPELTVTREVVVDLPTGVLSYTAPIPLTTSVRVKARGRSGNTWSALNEATFAVGPVAESLRISEIMYHPADTGSPDDPNTEYIELTNVGPVTINLNLVRFTDGVDVTLPEAGLAPSAYALVVKDVAAFEAKYGPGLPIIGSYTGSLNNAGERIELQDAAGVVIQSFRYSDDWYDMTDGPGFSLTASDLIGVGPNAWARETAWRPSAMLGGSPGFDDSLEVPALGTIVINELLANSAGGVPDWIELHNTGDRAVDVGGWFLSDDRDVPTKYEIVPGTVIAAGGYLVLSEDLHFGNDNNAATSETFGLSRNGETVYLRSGSAGVLGGYTEQASFGPSDPGVTLGRYRTSTGAVDFVPMSAATPGAENALPQVGPIVISEIMYHPVDSPDAEYVELLNVSDTDVTLYDFILAAPWRFSDGSDNPSIDLLLPADPPVTLAPDRYLVLVKSRALFESTYLPGSSAQIVEWGSGSLDNAGETLVLSKPGPLDDEPRTWIDVERVVYSDGSHGADLPDGSDPWPSEPDGQGLSLTRLVPDQYGNDPDNWHSATPSPGAARRRPGL